MVANGTRIRTTHGHIALYARDLGWRRSMAAGLDDAGHSYQQAADAAEMRRVLESQRFDLLALNVLDELEARDVAAALDDVPLPPHGILVGNANALPLVIGPRRAGTYRYVPGRLTARELSRLVEASISSGPADDGLVGSSSGAPMEEVDVEEAIERAAAAVYPHAKRRRLRFSTVVEGAERAYADPLQLRRALISLLRLVVALAPRGALVSVEARACGEEWTVRVCASEPGLPADALREEAPTLAALSCDAQAQGGLFWIEIAGSVALALCLTLPFAPAAQ